jgi:adenosylcobinamide kinase/adenosylcobinamide-phosphate guanylyltransferase
MKALITGGCRSGKSRRAQELAESLSGDRLYLATAEPLDAEMRERIRRHRADRGPSWRTVEEPLELSPHLDGDGVVLLDCLTLWVSNLMHARGLEADLSRDFERLAQAIEGSPGHVVVVTNEVGLGLVPDNAMARRFRDNAGWLAQRVARSCDRVEICVAGIPLVVQEGSLR